MKTCIILPCNIYNAPFYKRYEQMLRKKEINFDLIIWNRSNVTEETEGNEFVFNVYDNVNSGNPLKLINYIRFAWFSKKQLKSKKYDKIIILGSYAGIMALLSRFLTKKYKSKYWLDIRDYTFEGIKTYFNMMEKAISNSYTTVISSEGYKVFLPEFNYIIAHNIDYDNIEKSKEVRLNYNSANPIRISFIGLIRYFDANKKLIDLFANDERFILQFYGMNSEVLRQYCELEKIHNVDFHGRFLPSETAEFYKNTDIINNVYGNDSVAFTTALSNKLYFSVGLKIPILVSNGTYMEEISVKNGFGFAINYEDPKCLDKLYEWYLNLLSTGNKANYEDFYNRVLSEDLLFQEKFLEFISE